MKLQDFSTLALSIAIMASVCDTGAKAQRGTVGAAASSDNSLHAPEEQQRLHKRAMEHAERAERDLAAMVPSRSWTWGLNAERHLKHLDGLRRDLAAFQESETSFEKSLTSEQATQFQSQIQSIDDLMRHLEVDAQSLETELRNENPTRWHVAQDVTDMRKEIKHWKKLHQQIATAIAAPKPEN